MKINRFIANYSRTAQVVKKTVIFMAFFTPPALCNALSPWSLPGGYGLYPDVLVTITNGSGIINRTSVNCFTSSTNCTTGNLGYLSIFGAPFSYTSGHIYKANLARMYQQYFDVGCQSTQIRITDSLGDSATSAACLAVNCTSRAVCSFTPNTTSITF